MTDSSIVFDPASVEPKTKSHELLVGLRSAVSADGDGTTFDLAFTNQNPFRVLVPFGEMPALFTEIRQAQALMIARQRMRLDRGATALLELCDTALRPAHLDVLVDPRNSDRLFVHQFDDHAPIAFRVSPAELADNLQIMHRAVNANLN